MQLKEWRLPGREDCIYLSRDKRYACTFLRTKVRFYKPPETVPVFEVKMNNAINAYFSPEGRYCVLTNTVGVMYVVDMQEQKVIQRKPHAKVPENNHNVLFLNETTLLYAEKTDRGNSEVIMGTDTAVYQYEIDTKKTAMLFSDKDNFQFSNLVRDEGTVTILGTKFAPTEEGEDYSIAVLDLATKEITQKAFKLQNKRGSNDAGDYCPATGRYAIPTECGVQIYDSQFRLEYEIDRGGTFRQVYWLKNGKYLFLGDGSVWGIYAYSSESGLKLEKEMVEAYFLADTVGLDDYFYCAYAFKPSVLYQIAED